MTVVYVDSVFVLNGIMDYLMLLGTARLAGVPLRRRRCLLGAILGGAYAVAVFLPGLGFLAAGPVKVAAGVLLSVAVFGGQAHLLRLTVLLCCAGAMHKDTVAARRAARSAQKKAAAERAAQMAAMQQTVRDPQNTQSVPAVCRRVVDLEVVRRSRCA